MDLAKLDQDTRNHLTRKPVLVVNKKRTKEDLGAIELLAQANFRERLKIVETKSDDKLPRLFASVSTYYGLDEIKAFVDSLP
jgi:hypothetical protein